MSGQGLSGGFSVGSARNWNRVYTEFYRVLPSFTEFYRVFFLLTELNRLFVGSFFAVPHGTDRWNATSATCPSLSLGFALGLALGFALGFALAADEVKVAPFSRLLPCIIESIAVNGHQV